MEFVSPLRSVKFGLRISGYRIEVLRDLLFELVKKDLKVRYRRSVIGFLWTMLQPLLMMGVMYIVFSEVFRFNISNYPVYALVGILFWNFFSQSVISAMNSLRFNSGIIQKMPVPPWIFPVSSVISGTINLGLSFIPLAIILLLTGHKPTIYLFFLPISIIIITIFTLGVGLILSPLAVFFYDVTELVGVLLILLMYITPTFYPMSIVPPKFFWIVYLNPLRSMLEVFRDPIYLGKIPPTSHLSASIALGILSMLIGVYIFKTQSRKIAFHL